jgi:predicted DNA-binding transcriptional regulator AlpA
MKPETKLLRDHQVAERLNIARCRVWDLVKQGVLTPVKLPPRTTRFAVTEVDALCQPRKEG